MIRRFYLTTLGQIISIIAASSAITFLLFLALLWGVFLRVPPTPPWPWPIAYRIMSLVNHVLAAPEHKWDDVVAKSQRPDLLITLTPEPAACEAWNLDTRDLEALLRSEYDDILAGIAVRACESEEPEGRIQILIDLGDRTLDIRTAKRGRDPLFRFTFPFVGALLFLCVSVAVLSAWAVWHVIGPLRRLGEKADAFGKDAVIVPMAEEGPLEIRKAARAFNRMQERIAQSIRDRTRMLAAISHDLRTPLTRMRLQIETEQIDVIRDKLLRDIGFMQSMVTSALVFLSGGVASEEKEWLDIGALLSTFCDEYEEMGAVISYEGPEQIRCFCQPNAIYRALSNLIENAIHFGTTVTLTASAEGGVIRIDIADDGPGIQRNQVQQVIEPFVRLDPSRSDRAGSVGLGLSIVKEILQIHRGTLELLNRQPTGLIARVEILSS